MGRPTLADEVPWQALLHQAAGPIAIFDRQGYFVYVNPALCRLLGYDAEYLLRCAPNDVTHPDSPVVDRESIEDLLASSENSFEVEKRFLCADGSIIWAVVTSSLIQHRQDHPLFFLSQIQDVTARRETELLWQRTVAHAPIGMALLDLNGHWTEVNDQLCELVGYHRKELLGRHFLELTYPTDREEGMDALAELLSGRREVTSIEKRYRHKDGHPFWMLIRSSVIPGPNERPAYLVSQYEAIGEGHMRDSHLAHLALHDPLTGLANRALLTDRLERAFAELLGQQGMLAVLLIDLDDLKPVNDTYGHAAGDRLLATVADELLNAVRAGDTVARIGGDEFVVLTQVADFAAAEALRERISTLLSIEIRVTGQSLGMSASVGLAATRNPQQSADALLRDADHDMYRRKEINKRL
ncbi:PAS domain S-box protein [Parasphingorhabdus pacifica]